MPFGRLSWWPCLFVLTAMALAACGGRDDYGSSSNPPPAGSAPGTITLATTGLATGSSGALAITGPGGFVANIPTTQTSVAVPGPGDYTITAAEVLNGSRVLAPQAATQTITVRSGTTAAATVAYRDDRALALSLQQVVTSLVSPLYLTSPTGDARLFVVEQAGTIRIISGGVLLPTPFLSIPNPSRLLAGGERGLLSMAFDPQYAANGFFYVYLTDQNGDIAIERYQVSASNANSADPTPLRLLTISHRDFANHNGGLLAFGPDGMLYAATGDGGGGGDPLGSGQNLGSLLGKLLRIDVRNASSGTLYVVPPDNPFVAQAGARPETWAYGLRNPWRFAFDPPAGRLYIADVGQNRIEEINAVAAATAGLNYGWNLTSSPPSA
ncbi:MAG TPA: PQQ-dependent sugar dehydrogenase [Rhodocyclaceae bacterium]